MTSSSQDSQQNIQPTATSVTLSSEQPSAPNQSDEPTGSDLVTPAATLEAQPLQTFTYAGTHYTLLGTAHVSQASVDAVKYQLAQKTFDAVAIELDENRYRNIVSPQQFAELDLFKVIREGKAGMVAASLALGAFQQRIAEQLGIEPGAEMRAAIAEAEAQELPILLIDRDIGITLRRVYARVPWWQRINIFAGLMGGVMSRDEIKEEDIERLKEGDLLESTFSEFSERSQAIFTPLISERDAYMVARLKEDATHHPKAPFEHVLVVIGAGHLKGMVAEFNQESSVPASQVIAELEQSPKPPLWPKLIPWVIVALVLVGFYLSFQRGVGWSSVRDWVFINGTLAAIGALIARAHILTIIGVFLAAPLTSINPMIGAGYVGAGLELWLCKPRVGDFKTLRSDVTTRRGWWKNRVARTLLVFLLVTLGSAAGTWIAGAKIFSRVWGAA